MLSQVLFAIINRVAIFLGMLFLTACAGSQRNENLQQYLDGETGVTVTSLTAPLAFAREQPMLAVHARDYVYIAPLEINNAGRREYYVWLSGWSTIDHGARAAALEVPDGVVYLLADDEPVVLEGVTDPRLGRAPYSGPVDSGQSFYRVTRDQLRLLALAERLEMRLNRPGLYRPWHADAGLWLEFLAATADDSPVPVALGANDGS
jgi:hypothetical protein